MSNNRTRESPDFDRYQGYEDDGDLVIRDREVDGAWIRSDLSFEVGGTDE